VAYQTNRFPEIVPPLPELAREFETVGHWRQGLPVLAGTLAVLREVTPADAASLVPLLTTDEVTRFLIPPPPTIEGFTRFINWTLEQRAAGGGATFAITAGDASAIGLVQIRGLAPGNTIAEWGFAIGSPFWGSGIFQDAARLALAFAFDTLGVHRLEARTAVSNGRGNGALLKLGAVLEGTLRSSFVSDGQYVDQAIYSILASEWVPGRRRAATAFLH
jgi:RimJ/RimL family protein N-acetyltransferase